MFFYKCSGTTMNFGSWWSRQWPVNLLSTLEWNHCVSSVFKESARRLGLDKLKRKRGHQPYRFRISTEVSMKWISGLYQDYIRTRWFHEHIPVHRD